MHTEPGIEKTRRLLVQALSSGLLVGGLGWNTPALASWFGKVPRRLAEGRSIFDLRGDVRINGQPANTDTLIRPGDRVSTGDNGYVVFASGDTALALRERSVLETAGRELVIGSLKLVSGGLLAVFGRRRDALALNTPTATIGIRGTGVYAEADAEKTYFCTCYGTTDIAAAANPADAVSVTSTHHDAAKYILAQADGGKRVIPAPFKNHTDLELMTLEALVGRTVPFNLPASDYDAPGRDY